MWTSGLLPLLGLVLILSLVSSEHHDVTTEVTDTSFRIKRGDVVHEVSWGLALSEGAEGIPCEEGDHCLDFGEAKVVVTQTDEDCTLIGWTTLRDELKDCIEMHGHWYGGGEQFTQPWPIEKNPRFETAYVPSDMLQSAGLWYGGVIENYWISSEGLAIHVNETTPLFVSMPNNGSGYAESLCLDAKFEDPYPERDDGLPLSLAYYMCLGNDVRDVHEKTFPKFFDLPNAVPDQRMMLDPIWSTWAQFFTDVNDSRVIGLAQDIKDYGFGNSQIEIDDNWETCYGDQKFDPIKFPNPGEMVTQLQDEMGYRVTLWIHPFINDNCESFVEADRLGYFVKDEVNKTQLTKWWQGDSAGIIDFTNTEAVSWWNERLQTLKEEYGIDSFKFDAGEANWLPDIYTLQADKSVWPNVYTTKYAENLYSQFGDMIETRVGHRTQNSPFFVRMLDKSSFWNQENGLQTLIPSLLHFGLLGYPFVLPDMIGGNGYGIKPSAELYLRWAQANVLMPSIQFSIVPWSYGEETLEGVRKVMDFRNQYRDLLISLAEESVGTITPMMRPTWWLCPTDERCLTADQQYLVGDDLLITPVTKRSVEDGYTVVIPEGEWSLRGTGPTYQGPAEVDLNDAEHDLQNILYFTRN